MKKRFRFIGVCLAGGLAGALLLIWFLRSSETAQSASPAEPSQAGVALSSLPTIDPVPEPFGRVTLPKVPEGAVVKESVITAQEEQADPALRVALERATMRYTEPQVVTPGEAPEVKRILVGNVRRVRAGLFARLSEMAEGETLKVLLTFAEGAQVERILGAYGLREEARSKRMVTCTGSRETLTQLLNEMPEGLAFVEVAPKMELQNVVATTETFLGVEAPLRTNDSHLDGRGEVVSIFDTGISTGDVTSDFHVDLLPSLFGMTVEPSVARYLAGTMTPVDNFGHGTHVAGSVASVGKSTATRGAAPGAQLFFQRVASANGSIYMASALSEHFERSARIGAGVISMSLAGSESSGYGSTAQDIDQFAWDYPETLIFKAAGNSGVDEVNNTSGDSEQDGIVDLGSITCPYAQAKNVVLVGAQENQRSTTTTYGTSYGEPIASDKTSVPYDGENPGMSAISSRGPLDDGRIGPTLVTPGTKILSTYRGSSTKTATSDGTSMATPLAAGSAAVLRQYLREFQGFDGATKARPTSALVRAGLILCSDTLYPGQYGTEDYLEIPVDSPNSVEGWGALHLGKRLTGEETFGFEDRISLSTGETVTYTIPDVTEGTELAVVLSWIDAPGVVDEEGDTAADLVNNYDLSVTSPSGETTTLSDALNLQERILISSAEAGDYTITVSGTSINTTGSGNLAAVAWRATTSAGSSGVPAVEDSSETVTVTVNKPWETEAYVGYAFYPAPGTTTFNKGDSILVRTSPMLSMTSAEDAIYPSRYVLTWADGTTETGRVEQGESTTFSVTLDQDLTIDWIGTTADVTWTYTASGDTAILGATDGSTTAVDVSLTGELILPNLLDEAIVRRVAPSAFAACVGLTSVTIPYGVTSVGDSAFSGCTALTEVCLPKSLTALGSAAFTGCTALQNVIFMGEPVASVASDAFPTDAVLYGTYPSLYASEWEAVISNGKWKGIQMAEAGTLEAIYRTTAGGSVTASEDETTVTASASDGYTFIGWSDGSTETTRTVSDSDDLVVALFMSSTVAEATTASVDLTSTVQSTEISNVTREISFGEPTLTIEDGSVTMGFTLQAEGTTEGEWSTVTPSEATLNDDGSVSVTLPNPTDGMILYQFTEGPTTEEE